MLSYPTASDFAEALPVLLNVLRGKVALAEDLHSLWICAGYSASKLLPVPAQALATDVAGINMMSLADMLEANFPRGGAVSSPVAAINWAAVLKIVVQIITTILAAL